MTPAERWERKVQKGDGCWIWIGAKKPSGYGNFYMNGRYLGAHQAAFELFCGAIPAGMYVCHRCDNPSCVNPDHLFLGTPYDNQADMAAKGRAVGIPQGGEHHPMAKLTAERAAAIRAMRRAGASLKEVAAEFCVSQATVSFIASGKIWRDA